MKMPTKKLPKSARSLLLHFPSTKR
jgi:hypothetical protein